MKDTITLKPQVQASHSSIYFGSDFFHDGKFLKTCQRLSKRCVILTDNNVASLYGNTLMTFLKEQTIECSMITISAGESYKNRQTKENIENEMLARQLGKDTCLIAIGGGVVTDIGGFVAATYCRGIPYLTIPTTLLGMVDSSIGSKTGVNVNQGKNFIGSTYPPYATFMNLSVLETLPDNEIRNGTIEIVKHGLIAHRPLFNHIVEDLDKWQQRDFDFLRKIIYESCQVKKKVVEIDFHETGMRRMLNFGHTLGHAIETLEEYKISHGEAVAIGIIAESLISYKLGYLKKEDFEEIYSLIKIMGFPLTLSSKITEVALRKAFSYDKKTSRNTPRFVVLEEIGKVLSFKGEYCTPLDDTLLRDTINWILTEFRK